MTTVLSLVAVGPASAAVRSGDHACPPGEVPASPFVDVDPAGAHGRAIACMWWWQLVEGTSFTTYAPGSEVTRGQMATLLVGAIAAAGGTLPDAPPDRFIDDQDSMHERSIDQLAALGIVVGQGELLRPIATVSRGQMATMVMATLEHLLDGPLPDASDAFSDDDGSTHGRAIDRAAAAGVASGVAPGRYAPTREVSRAQTASLVARALDLLVEEGAAAPPA